MLSNKIKQKYQQKDFKNIKTSFGIKQQAIEGTLDLYIYDDVEESYTDWWTGELIGETSAQFIREKLASNPDVGQINVYINSYGGDVKEGLAIFNQLDRHPANVTVYIDGFACSIASVIAMAGNEIIMGSNTLMMIHRAWMFTYGNSKELRKAADDLEVIDSSSTSSYLNKINGKLSEEELNKMLDDETWLTAQQCFEYGLCTQISSSQKEESNTITDLNQKLNDSKDIITQKDTLIVNMQKKIEELEQPKKNPKNFLEKINQLRGGL